MLLSLQFYQVSWKLSNMVHEVGYVTWTDYSLLETSVHPKKGALYQRN